MNFSIPAAAAAAAKRQHHSQALQKARHRQDGSKIRSQNPALSAQLH
jgi:hypothetical protein